MPDLELDIGAQLVAAVGSMTAMLEQQERQRQAQSQAVRQVPLTGPPPNAAGIIDMPDLLMAKTGYYWSVRRLVLSGFSAGTAVVYRNSAITGVGEVLVPYAAAAAFTFGRGEMLLMPGDRLVVQATGITGTVQLNGAADCFEQWYLPYYIG